MRYAIARTLICCTILTALCATGGELAAQSLGYRLPPVNTNSWRGKMVSRRGLFNVDRAHWGNGITPAGQAVLVSGFQTFGQVAPVLFGTTPQTSGSAGNGSGEGIDELEESGAVNDDPHAERINEILKKQQTSVAALKQMQRDLCGLFTNKPDLCNELDEPLPAAAAPPPPPGKDFIRLPGTRGNP